MTARRGDWIQTFTGKAFYPLDPRAEDLEIVDVAHALSHQCRYAGHCERFYCPTLSQRVLTADLEWRLAGDLKVGDEILGFDAKATELGAATTLRRRYRPSIVTHAKPVKRQTWRLEMEDGSTVVSSAEHPWLVATKASRNQSWLRTAAIADAVAEGRARYIHRFFKPWRALRGRDAGWLAGMYDGEGSLSTAGRTGVQMNIAQKPGLVAERISAMHAAFGYIAPPVLHASGVAQFQMQGGWQTLARFLGEVRPLRLLAKFKERLLAGSFAKQLQNKEAPLRIVRAYKEGAKWVAGLSTSTQTYICEGFGAHNSVAQHSLLVSEHVTPEYALWGLLHDASEAYLVDLPRPIKRSMPDYVAAEKRLQSVIAERWGLPPDEPEEVKLIDRRILADERKALLGPMQVSDAEWGATDPPLGIKVVPITSFDAKWRFLERFEELLKLRATAVVKDDIFA